MSEGSRFEVWKDKKVCQSGPLSLIPPLDRRKQMRAAGYKIYVDGKVYTK